MLFFFIDNRQSKERIGVPRIIPEVETCTVGACTFWYGGADIAWKYEP